jgi:hypothetical protein
MNFSATYPPSRTLVSLLGTLLFHVFGELSTAFLRFDKLLNDLEGFALLIVPVKPPAAPWQAWMLRAIPELPADPDLEIRMRVLDLSLVEKLAYLGLQLFP